ncbi:hypothetical protein CS8_009080 [Cupriavidus sp. 8B]
MPDIWSQMEQVTHSVKPLVANADTTTGTCAAGGGHSLYVAKIDGVPSCWVSKVDRRTSRSIPSTLTTSHGDVFVGMLSAVGPIDPETPPTYAGAQLASISDDSRSPLVANDLAGVLNRT